MKFGRAAAMRSTETGTVTEPLPIGTMARILSRRAAPGYLVRHAGLRVNVTYASRETLADGRRYDRRHRDGRRSDGPHTTQVSISAPPSRFCVSNPDRIAPPA